MIYTWLEEPVDPPWLQGPDYDDEVDGMLNLVYDAIQRKAYRAARPLLDACLRRAMSARQRVRVQYALGMLNVGERKPDLALRHLDEALDLVAVMGEVSVCAPLAYLRASVHAELSHYAPAAEYYDIAVEVLQADQSLVERDPAFAQSVFLGASTHEFLLARSGDAQRHLAEARLLPGALEPHTRAASEWITALLERWRGDLWTALGRAISVSDAYIGLAIPTSVARIHSVVAEIALDLADVPHENGLNAPRDDMLSLAGKYSAAAVAWSDAVRDPSGSGLALLSHIRHNRLSGGNQDGMPLIDRVEALARRLRDGTLLGQVQTARGYELVACGSIEEAATCFRQAVATLTAMDSLAMAVWPQRALRRLDP